MRAFRVMVWEENVFKRSGLLLSVDCQEEIVITLISAGLSQILLLYMAIGW